MYEFTFKTFIEKLSEQVAEKIAQPVLKAIGNRPRIKRWSGGAIWRQLLILK